MSAKNKDDKNRWRNKTVAFRLSPEEYDELTDRTKLCGFRTKQDFPIESALHQQILAKGTPMMLVQFRRQLRQISEQLEHSSLTDEERDELHISINIMREILEAFAYERDLNGEGR